jgi:hypothetical protein
MTLEIQLRLYEELNDHLAPELRKRRFSYPLNGITNVRELLSRLGVPEDEVEIVLINGESAALSDRLAPGDSVSLYPVFESLDVAELIRMRERPLRETRFMVDRGLEHLAEELRSTGFDVHEGGSMMREEMVRTAEEQKRILVTTDPEYLNFPALSRVCVLREQHPKQQLHALLTRLDLGSDQDNSH